MRELVSIVSALLGLAGLIAGPAAAEPSLAIVIGIERYEKLPALLKAVNDPVTPADPVPSAPPDTPSPPQSTAPSGAPPPPVAPPRASGPPGDEMGRFVSRILGSADVQWKKIFEEAGLSYKAPTLVLFAGQTRTDAC